jgi:quercetin dioxygenase-like cupin family protein
MSAVKIARADARVTETPNATMTTFASPTQGGTSGLSLWRVSMHAGQRGPEHNFDVEQAWHLLEGTATVVAGAETIELSVGDTVVIPSGVPRQIGTGDGAVFVVSGGPDGTATVTSPEGPGEPVSPAWIV